jgi:hypothetical protein
MNEAEKLWAIDEITQVKARYYRCMDMKDWAGFAAVFAPDISVNYGPVLDDSDLQASGRDNVVALVRGAVGTAVSIHHGHMPEIEITGPASAHAIFAMEDLIFWPEGSPLKTMHGWGHYHETYVKTGGHWLIQTLKLTRLRVEYT